MRRHKTGIRDWGLGIRKASPLPLGEGQGVRAVCASPRPLAGEGQGVRATTFASLRLCVRPFSALDSLTQSRKAAKKTSPGSPIPNPQSLIPRPAFTLIELLIVITITLILMVSAAVMLAPALQNRSVREAARAVNAYLSSARNAAMETGLPCGVIFRCFNTATPCAMTLEQCAVPPPYAGDTIGAAMTLQASISGTVATVTATPVVGSGYTPSLVAPGGLIQFNGQGPLYTVTSAGPPLIATLDISQGQLVPWPAPPSSSPPVPYSIFRSPVSSGVAPLQMPTGTVVDFTASGIGVGNAPSFYPSPPTPPGDVTILFAADGSVASYNIAGSSSSPVTDPIFFLIGRRERMLNSFVTPPISSANLDQLPNVQDLGNYWIGVNSQTGLIATDMVAAPLSTSTTLPAVITDARAIISDLQGMGGK